MTVAPHFLFKNIGVNLCSRYPNPIKYGVLLNCPRVGLCSAPKILLKSNGVPGNGITIVTAAVVHKP